jgi:uncharacterized protein (DUF1778 family)
MSKARDAKSTPKSAASALTVRLDEEGKRLLAEAAELRRISVSDYVRTVTVAQARREVASAREQTIALNPEEQQEFWRALQAPAKPTPAQKHLGSLMRGETPNSGLSNMGRGRTKP